MKNNKKQTFMKGAFILIVANIIVKVIGAAFKIPLTYLLHEDGMALFTTSYTMYTWLFIVATAGIPVAISRMISESRAKHNYGEVKKIFSVSFRLLAVIGIAGSCILFFGAGFFAEKLGNPDAKLGIMAISPAMLFVSFMSAYRGYFQGYQDMYPTAISEVSEAIGKLAIGYIGAFYLIGYGITYAAAGAVFGVAMGGFLGFIVLFGVYNFKKNKEDSTQSIGIVRSNKTILKELIAIAIPITIGASVFSLTSLIDMAMIMRNLSVAGFTYHKSKFLWGSYSGYAVPLFNMPPTLISAISISIVPAISGAFSIGNKENAQRMTKNGILIALLFALPCAFGMSLLAEPILALIYHNTNSASTLSILGYAVVFVSIVMVTNAILQSIGKEIVPVINMLIGGIVKVVINNWLVKTPEININGAPIGTNVCYMVILILNIIWIKKELKIKFSLMDYIIKPLVCVGVMSVVVLFAYRYTMMLGGTVALLLSIVSGGVVYLVMLFALRIVDEDLMETIPGMKRFIPILKKSKLLK